MNNQGHVTADWGDGTYSFRLSVLDAIELEQKCGSPFSVVWRRVQAHEWGIADIRETVRLGLIGGGLKPAEALKLVRRYCDERPLTESWPVAAAILAALMFGFENSPLDKGEGDTEGKDQAAPIPSQSTPQPSTQPPQSLDAMLADLDALASGNFTPQ